CELETLLRSLKPEMREYQKALSLKRQLKQETLHLSYVCYTLSQQAQGRRASRRCMTTRCDEKKVNKENEESVVINYLYIYLHKESPSKRLAKEIENDPSNPFVAFGLPSKNDSDELYCPSSDESKYHNISVQKASENNIREAAEILSLNHIFLFEEHTLTGIQKTIEPESLKIIFENIRNEFIPYQLSDNDIVRYYTIVKTANQNFQNCKPLLRKWQKQVEDDQEDLILEVFESIALHDVGIYSYVSAKKPFISEKHALVRISWCEKYKEKTAYDWVQVIFSDESSVEIGKQS
ncbi:6143_t:CDS:2, partial [Funneliformis caledonium]